MANFFSDILIDANSDTIIDAGEVAGNLIMSTSVVDLTVEPSNGDVLLFADIPSNAKIKSLRLFNDNIDSGSNVIVDIGIFAGERISRTDGTVFDENEVIQVDTFVDNLNILFQTNLGTEVRYNSDGAAFEDLGGYANSQLALWQLAGAANLPEDPFKYLRIGITLVVAIGTFVPGKVLLQITYTGKT